MCFNVSITKDTGQYLATFNHVGYLFYAKLSDKESETLLVCTDKVMIVVAISSSLNKTCLSLNLGVGYMRENVAGELDSD